MFLRILKYSLKNILRNKFLSISSVLVLTLLMFFINLLLVLHSTSFKIIDSVNSKLTISLYLKDNYDKNSLEVINLMKDLGNISNSIETNYKSKDELIEDLKERDPKLVGILEKENPLPNTITIGNIGLSEYELINDVIERKMYMFDNGDNKDKTGNFTNYSSQYQKIIKIIFNLNTLIIGLNIIISLFLVSISIIVYSVIGNFIYYYRDEIYITKLVGGNNFFIYGPFVFQGIIYSIISFVLSAGFFVISLFFLNNLGFLFSEEGGFLNYLYSTQGATLYTVLSNLYIYFGVEILLFSFIGGLSGYFSSKKYL